MIKELLKELGYDENSIEKIMKWYSSSLEDTLYSYIIHTFDYLKSKGYSKLDVVKITKTLPAIFSISNENIETKLNYLKSKGYSESDIIKMTKTLPSIFSHSESNIETKLNYLKSKGYSESDIIKMTKKSPSIFSYSEENIENRFKYLKSKEYSKQDIIKMTKTLPTIFSISNENIDKKIEFYKEIDLEFIITEDTLQLMQSVELTYARYRFLSDLGINITQDNYTKLFYNQKQFIKQFGISNEELLNRYPYNEKVLVKEV